MLQRSIGRLAQFMANPDSLYRAIRERYGAGGALPEQWQTLLESLPKSGPLLQFDGEKGKWLVDIFSSSPAVASAVGSETAVAPPSVPVVPTQAAEPEPVVEVEGANPPIEANEGQPDAAEDGATAEDYSMALQKAVKPMKPITFVSPEESVGQLQAAILRESIGTIQAIDREIRDMTEERLNLDRLATELRIIDISPPFEAFVLSARSVAEVLRHGQMSALDSASVSVIHGYRENLRQASGPVLKTFFLAALLASSEGKLWDPRRLSAALRFLSTELEFSTHSTEQLDELLSNLLIEAFALRERGTSLVNEFPFLAEVTVSQEALKEAADQAPQFASRLTSIEDPSLLRWCYGSRARKLIRHLRSGDRLPSMSFLELRLLYEGKVTRFSGDPNAITLGDYARALRAANAAGAEDFIMTVFLKLGFVSYVRKTITAPDVKKKIDPDLWQDIQEQAELQDAKPGVHRVLIVTGEPLKWVPSTQWAVVQLDPELVQKLETPQVSTCLTGKDVDGETTIRIRRLLPGVRVTALEEDAGSVDEAIRRSLSSSSRPSNPPSSSASTL